MVGNLIPDIIIHRACHELLTQYIGIVSHVDNSAAMVPGTLNTVVRFIPPLLTESEIQFGSSMTMG